MVRFHWHVEEGTSAYIPPGGVTNFKETNIRLASCDVEVFELTAQQQGLNETNYLTLWHDKVFLVSTA